VKYSNNLGKSHTGKGITMSTKVRNREVVEPITTRECLDALKWLRGGSSIPAASVCLVVKDERRKKGVSAKVEQGEVSECLESLAENNPNVHIDTNFNPPRYFFDDTMEEGEAIMPEERSLLDDDNEDFTEEEQADPSSSEPLVRVIGDEDYGIPIVVAPGEGVSIERWSTEEFGRSNPVPPPIPRTPRQIRMLQSDDPLYKELFRYQHYLRPDERKELLKLTYKEAEMWRNQIGPIAQEREQKQMQDLRSKIDSAVDERLGPLRKELKDDIELRFSEAQKGVAETKKEMEAKLEQVASAVPKVVPVPPTPLNVGSEKKRESKKILREVHACLGNIENKLKEEVFINPRTLRLQSMLFASLVLMLACVLTYLILRDRGLITVVSQAPSVAQPAAAKKSESETQPKDSFVEKMNKLAQENREISQKEVQP
jgi:hypothetical protein